MVCLMILIMIIIGGVSASEDIDPISASDDGNETLQINEIDEEDNLATDSGSVSVDNQNSNIDREVLSSMGVDDISDDVIMHEGKKISKEEALGASSDEDVLSADGSNTVNDSSTGDNFNKLNDLITQNRGKNIVLTHDYSYPGGNAAPAAGITLNNIPSITGNLDGNGGIVTIERRGGYATAAYVSRVFIVPKDSNINITNIKFYLARASYNSNPEFGGAVYVYSGSHVVFRNCIFEDNSQCEKGGAVYFQSGATAEFINCTFKDNLLWHEHNNKRVGGSALYFESANGVNFTDCTFDHNYYQTGKKAGGTAVVYFGDNSKNINIDNCSFNDGVAINEVNGGDDMNKFGMAGELYFGSNLENVTIKNSNFTNNNAARYGGAIYIKDKCTNFIIEDCLFENNTVSHNNPRITDGGQGGAIYVGGDADTFKVINSTFENNDAYKDGGAIYFATKVDNLLVNGSTFSNNDATGGNGAGIYIPAGSNITVTNSTFTKNIASNIGGAIYWGSSESFKTKDSTFEGNEAEQGATIYFKNNLREIIVRDTEFLGNKETGGNGGALKIPLDATADTLYIINCTFRENDVNGDGAAVYVPEGVKNVHVYNCTFEDNTATGNGGALYLANKNELVIVNVTFARNIANEGPNVYIANSMNRTLFNNTKFINNTARTGNGAGISLEKVTNAEFNNCTFDGNNALRGNGGALFVPNTVTSIILNDIDTYTNNNAGLYGGAIYWGVTPYLDINGYTFINNSATDAGAIYYEYALNDKVFNDVTFINNTASNDGGALYIHPNSKNLLFIDSIFIGNNATGGEGGAIYFHGSCTNITINNILFDKNTATSGGAVHFYATSGSYTDINIIDSNFTNNKATANDIYGGSAIGLNRAYGVKFSRCIFDSNVATSNGAVMFDNYKDILFTECNFTNNNASKNGGAIYYMGTLNNGNSTYIKCNFENNNASESGGAIYSKGNDITIIENNFTNNYAYSYGGAFINFAESYNQTKNVKIVNSSFVNNYAWKGAGLDIYHTKDAHIINCTFDNNVAGFEGAGIWIDGFYGLITNSTFINNHGPRGSAIAYIPELKEDIGETKANITNCIFERNTASEEGTVWFESSSGKMNNCNFTENVAKYGGGVYVNVGNVYITNSNFNRNNATDEGGAIYLNTNATGSHIEYCEFNDNYAKNGGAISVNANEISIISSNFIKNNATKGGAVYYAPGVLDDVVQGSTFKQNTAENGGAVYSSYSSSTNKAAITVDNSSFIDNIAKYNGGAVYIGLNNGKLIYRDYKDFDGKAVKDAQTQRLNLTDNEKQIIKNSLFSGNKDYLFEVIITSSAPAMTITVNIPEYVDKSKIKVTVSNATMSEEYTPSNSRWDPTENGQSLTLEFSEGKYNITVSFEDSNCNYKQINTTYTLTKANMGNFEKLQRAIDEAIREGKTELVINETVLYSEGLDQGQIIINASITLIGKTMITIDAKNHCRIFDVRAPNVTFKNIRFVNGNASGDNSTSHDKINGGAILWEGVNGTIENCNFSDNWAYNGGAVFVQNTGVHGRIIDSTFENNIAVHNGGAVDWNATGGNVTNTRFISNSAQYGGALFVGSNSTLSYLTKSNFTKNVATARGGALRTFFFCFFCLPLLKFS